MKIIVDIGHPAHVHFFKYTMRNLQKKGHQIKICVRERENIVKTLLNTYNFPFERYQIAKNCESIRS
jgi:predicted glycosyltransferase